MTTVTQAVRLAGLPTRGARAYLRECSMTLPERERYFYISGRVADADLVAQAGDAQIEVDDELRHERDMAKDKAKDLEKENDSLRDQLEAAETRALNLSEEVEELRQEFAAAGLDLV